MTAISSNELIRRVNQGDSGWAALNDEPVDAMDMLVLLECALDSETVGDAVDESGLVDDAMPAVRAKRREAALSARISAFNNLLEDGNLFESVMDIHEGTYRTGVAEAVAITRLHGVNGTPSFHPEEFRTTMRWASDILLAGENLVLPSAVLVH